MGSDRAFLARPSSPRTYALCQAELGEKLGLQSGDRLRRVAGVELTSLEAGLSAMARLRGASRFSIELVRAR